MSSINKYTKNGKTAYYVSYWYKDRDGSKNRTVERGFKTKKEAEAFAREKDDAFYKGIVRHDPNKTVAQLLEEWNREYVEKRLALGKLKKNTLDGYQVNIEHIKTGLGNIKLAELTPEKIEDFYIEKRVKGNRRTNGSLASRSILYIHRNLYAALKYAVKKKYLTWNPAEDAEMVNIENKPSRICTAEELKILLNDTASTELEIPVMLALSLGLRRGEILGLRWKDIDFANNKAHISHQLAMTPDGIALTSVKSFAGDRHVPIVPEVSKALMAHRCKQEALKKSFGPKYHDHGLICCHEDGDPILPDYFSQGYRRFTERKGFPDLRFHDLRHTFASLALSAGVPMAVVSSLLGHSSISVTVDIYGHIIDNAKSSAMHVVFDAISTLAGLYKSDLAVDTELK